MKTKVIVELTNSEIILIILNILDKEYNCFGDDEKILYMEYFKKIINDGSASFLNSNDPIDLNNWVETYIEGKSSIVTKDDWNFNNVNEIFEKEGLNAHFKLHNGLDCIIKAKYGQNFLIEEI
jgi:hypothetical protein